MFLVSVQIEVCFSQSKKRPVQFVVCIFSVRHVVGSVIHVVWSVQYIVCSMHGLVCSANYEVWAMQCEVYTMKYEVCSILYVVWASLNVMILCRFCCCLEFTRFHPDSTRSEVSCLWRFNIPQNLKDFSDCTGTWNIKTCWLWAGFNLVWYFHPLWSLQKVDWRVNADLFKCMSVLYRSYSLCPGKTSNVLKV